MMLPPLYLITDSARLGEPRVLEAVEAAVRGGVRLVQVREKALEEKELTRFIERLRSHLPDDVHLIVNRRPELVIPLDLAGVHVGGDPYAVGDVRERVAPPRRVGYSAHTLAGARIAFEQGADYVSFSPIFPPQSKRSTIPAVGVDGLREVCEAVAEPVYALGGIDAGRVADVKRAGAHGVAVIGAILDAANPEEASREILAAWNP